MTVHVLGYAPRAMYLAWLDRSSRGRDAVAGTLTRRSFLVASVLLGIAIAAALLPLDTTWVHWVSLFHGDG